ncbi:hypothetical protein [Streptomyces luteolus]|uniref:Uncharacterized protein n=1 Tax=Streptomyces luteolus TaxID=3043615 RepID=A0ABT6SZJ1_9ACTN|nr:hypothetical protein [Streptomyces sp. B-S-A12]MDI3421023.1 hypothetical protein [Streptomyces sp. B-S-A12]
MEYGHSALLAAAEFAEFAAEDQGPGNTLRIVLVASLVGAALLAWLLLRGYRRDADDDGDDA